VGIIRHIGKVWGVSFNTKEKINTVAACKKFKAIKVTLIFTDN
jgi:hypothetical protein